MRVCVLFLGIAGGQSICEGNSRLVFFLGEKVLTAPNGGCTWEAGSVGMAVSESC